MLFLLLDRDALKRTLQSLACAKKKVLKKIPPGKEVDDTDVFRYNIDFDDPHPKIHINSIQTKFSVSAAYLFGVLPLHSFFYFYF